MGWSRASHNILLQYGVEMGILGVVAVAVIWWLQLRESRRLEAIPQLQEEGVALTATLVALAFASMFLDLFGAKMLWLAFALVAQLRAYAVCQRFVPLPRRKGAKAQTYVGAPLGATP